MSRSYHSTDAAYLLPNDASEHERLNIQAQAIDEMMGQKTQAPVKNPRSILDIGCGTGINTRGLAAMFPEAKVSGIDLTPVPDPGFNFIQGDFMTADVPEVDYAFSRLLVYGVTDWPAYIAKVKTVLAPGGWFEMQEVESNMFRDDTGKDVTARWPGIAKQDAVSRRMNLDMGCARHLEQYLNDAGFADVGVKQYRWALGPYKPETKFITAYSRKYLPDALLAALRRIPTLSSEDVKEIHADWVDLCNCDEPGFHTTWWVVYGRKPE